ncbi:hypothetical protein V9T40_014736 [Parthenolecanium corni]|uniref:Uncharacterized protein n=1 Tax=Parthenolecanium corni TaxID=536013 RepID=A0AAN9XX71_9HEMI
MSPTSLTKVEFGGQRRPAHVSPLTRTMLESATRSDAIKYENLPIFVPFGDYRTIEEEVRPSPGRSRAPEPPFRLHTAVLRTTHNSMRPPTPPGSVYLPCTEILPMTLRRGKK